MNYDIQTEEWKDKRAVVPVSTCVLANVHHRPSAGTGPESSGSEALPPTKQCNILDNKKVIHCNSTFPKPTGGVKISH